MLKRTIHAAATCLAEEILRTPIALRTHGNVSTINAPHNLTLLSLGAPIEEVIRTLIALITLSEGLAVEAALELTLDAPIGLIGG